MKRTSIYFLLSLLTCWFLYAQEVSIIPSVSELKITSKGYWKIPSKVRVFASSESENYLSFFEREIMINKKIKYVKNEEASVVFKKNPQIPQEAYVLSISRKGLQINASTDAGFFYALQTLVQLKTFTKNSNALPYCEIYDQPAYRWRTFMLDSGRQYQNIATIKKYLDMMAMLKMNVFHWHLTEGLGWRIEIKKYPSLAIEGSKVANGPEQQGYYTQEEIKEIIEYASQRYITVVPEIDMPGHAEAALSVFPEYTCFNKPVTIPEVGFTPQIFCAGKPETINFLKDILDEVCELFPSEYIHLGGDEALKDNWDQCPDCQHVIHKQGLKDSHDLQIWFSNEMAAYLKTKGRKAIFWDDVIAKEGNIEIAENAVIHWWQYRGRKDQPLKKALSSGREILCGTNNYNYLNFPLTPWKGYKENRTFDMQDVFNHNPSRVDPSNPLVLGMSCSLWTDYVVQEYMIDRRLFPRIFIIANQMWYTGNEQSFEMMKNKIEKLKPWFENKGYEFGPGLKSEVPEGYKWD